MKSSSGSVFLFLIIFFAGIIPSFAQLNISPQEINFSDVFNRLKNVNFINTSQTDTITIDSIYYNSSLFTIRFNSYNKYPMHIPPGDSLEMDCILSGYFLVTKQDTSDTMVINYNSQQSDVKIKIGFYEESLEEGNVSGTVSSNGNALSNATINFYYEGIYFFAKTTTDQYGNYTIRLPKGEYTALAKKDGYDIAFYNNRTSPIDANRIKIVRDTLLTINFDLNATTSTGVSISGFVIDKRTSTNVNRGIVIVRNGSHTPSKILANQADQPIYAALINPDGSYEMTLPSVGDGYFIQSFSDFYTPSYYSQNNSGTFIWQQGDSININGNLTNLDISMLRDSSFGGGTISGIINKPDSTFFSYSDIIVYAQSVSSGQPFNYSFVDSTGSFALTELPYGTYKVYAQKIKYNDAIFDNNISITPATISASGIILAFNNDVASVDNNSFNPITFLLFQNYPNPFNPSTTIRFQIEKITHAIVKVTNILGQEVTVLKDETLAPGNYNIKFNGNKLSSGPYFISLITDYGVQVKKMMLLK
jgi:Secretion system C-terminal sorting domain/Carboxypeptidase regulatory-like domain